MKCPSKDCKEGELYYTEELGSSFKEKWKVLYYFCPVCGWNKRWKMNLTKKQYKLLEEKEPQVYKLEGEING